MTPKRTDDQRRALAAHRGEPIYLVDAQTQATYVLLPATQYERVAPLFVEDAFALCDSYPLQDAVARSAGWDDPRLDAYDRATVDNAFIRCYADDACARTRLHDRR